MIIVLRNKMQMIHEPHRLLETRMQARSCKSVRFKYPHMVQAIAWAELFFGKSRVASIIWWCEVLGSSNASFPSTLEETPSYFRQSFCAATRS